MTLLSVKTGRMTAFVTTIVSSLVFFLVLAMPAKAVDIREVVTDKGIKALLVEDYTLPIVALSFSFKGGTTQDEPGKEGTLSLMRALLDEGAGDLDSTAYQAKAEEIGLEFGFSASRDSFSGGGRMLRSQLDESLELIRLAINEPRFDAEPMERMRDAIRTNIIRGKKNPSSVAQDALRKAIFEGHPYGRETTVESIDAITREDVIAINRKLLARENLVIGAVGAISEDELKDALNRIFGDLPLQSSIEDISDIDPKLGETLSISMPVPNANITKIYPAIKRDNPDFFAAHLMNHILGGGTFSSRLFVEVREKRGLAYGVSSGIASLDHTAYLAIGTTTRAENREEVVGIIQDEIQRIRDEGVTQEELDKAKRYVAGVYAISNLDTSSKIARVLVAIQSENLGIDYIDRREKYIEAVTLEDVNRLAKEFFSKEPTTVVVGPELTQ